MERELKVSQIGLGKRYRKDFGDIDGLARSISKRGLLHPLVVTPSNTLICGARRLRAVKQLGWKKVLVHVVDIDKIVSGEHDENTQRKDFTLEEEVQIRRALRPLEERTAKERQGARTDKHSGNFPECSAGDTRDKVAKGLKRSGRTLEKAEAVVSAAEKNPAKYGELVQEMNDTEKVDPAYRKLRAAQGKGGNGSKKGGSGTKPIGTKGKDEVKLINELYGMTQKVSAQVSWLEVRAHVERLREIILARHR